MLDPLAMTAAAAAAAAGAAQAAAACEAMQESKFLPSLSLAWLLLWLLLLLCPLMGCSLRQLLCILLNLLKVGHVVSRRAVERWKSGPQMVSKLVLVRWMGGELQLPLHLSSLKASMGASTWVGP